VLAGKESLAVCFHLHKLLDISIGFLGNERDNPSNSFGNAAAAAAAAAFPKILNFFFFTKI
jgi:hypothetical protein